MIFFSRFSGIFVVSGGLISTVKALLFAPSLTNTSKKYPKKNYKKSICPKILQNL